MICDTFITVPVREVIGSMMESASHQGLTIIMSSTIAEVRTQYPNLKVPDDVLTAAIMAEAIQAGASVEFDGSGENNPLVPVPAKSDDAPPFRPWFDSTRPNPNQISGWNQMF